MTTSKESEQQAAICVPEVSLPTGGGGLHKVSEKFEPDLSTGGGHYAFKLALTQARALTPNLVLTYNTNQGRQEYGQGFELNLEQIKRKTSQQVPSYDDEQDTFIFAGQDLVFLRQNEIKQDTISWQVRYYRPRVLEHYVEFEYWSRQDDSFWIMRKHDGIEHIFGDVPNAKLSDPNSPNHARIFAWLITKVRDVKGNYISYTYHKQQIPFGLITSVNCFLETIRYGNYRIDNKEEFAFHLEFSYEQLFQTASDDYHWPDQLEPNTQSEQNSTFLSFRAGFTTHNKPLCRNILLWHKLDGRYANKKFLVKHWDLSYEAPSGDRYKPPLLQRIQVVGYKCIEKEGGFAYIKKEAPPINFCYQQFKIHDNEISKDNQLKLPNGDPLPLGDFSYYQWVDLYREGLPGIMYSDAYSTLFYRNKGHGYFALPERKELMPIQSNLQANTCKLMDLGGNHQLDWVVSDNNGVGFYRVDGQGCFSQYTKFNKYPYEYADPYTELLDLEGNGRVDALVWHLPARVYPGLGEEGYGAPKELKFNSADKDEFPQGMWEGERAWLGFADLLGDGLAHRVNIGNRSIVCWPNLGNGNFGPKFEFKNPPLFTEKDEDFCRKQLFLVDIDGSGVKDLVYVERDTLSIYFNQGLKFSKPVPLKLPELYSSSDTLHFVDLFGSGTICLVYSKNGYNPKHYYYDFCQGKKPYLLNQIENGLGVTIQISYTSSIAIYLSKPSKSKLPFAQPVLEEITHCDEISGIKLTEKFRFHDGYYDTQEREFCGFGHIEHWNSQQTENIDNTTVPAYTKLWYHTGKLDESSISKCYSADYCNDVIELEDSQLEDTNSKELKRQAVYALKGKLLRKEVYGEINKPPYVVEHYNFAIKKIEFNTDMAVWQVRPREAVFHHYEQGTCPRIKHHFWLAWDDYGYLTEEITAYYPYSDNKLKLDLAELDSSIFFDSQDIIVIYTNKKYQHYRPTDYHLNQFQQLGILVEEKVQSLTGLKAKPLSFKDFVAIASQPSKLLHWQRYFYWTADLSDVLPYPEVNSYALLHHIETAVEACPTYQQKFMLFAENLNVDALLQQEAGYVVRENYYWRPGLVQFYQPRNYFLPVQLKSYGNLAQSCELYAKTCMEYDRWSIALQKMITFCGDKEHEVRIEQDLHVFKIAKLIDPNDNTKQALYDPLGVVVAVSYYGKVAGKIQGDVELSDNMLFELTKVVEMDVIIKEPTHYTKGTQTFYYGYNNKRIQPSWRLILSREQHTDSLGSLLESTSDEPSFAIAVDYIDGFGESIQTKKQVTSLESKNPWLVTGYTHRNHKGLPVKAYLPYYTNHFSYENQADSHSSLPAFIDTEYDVLNRVIKITHADDSYRSTSFHAWYIKHTDENGNSKFDILDSREQVVIKVAVLKEQANKLLPTRTVYDEKARVIAQKDPRFAESSESNIRYDYDLLDQVLSKNSIDAGEQVNLYNRYGNLIREWTSRNISKQWHYDQLQRLIKLRDISHPTGPLTLIETTYGYHPDNNQYGQIIKQCYQAETIEYEQFDIHGRCLKLRRQLADPQGINLGCYEFEMRYQVSGALIEKKFPNEFIYLRLYDLIGRLSKVELHTTSDAQWVKNILVKNITYHPTGQRQSIEYGNGCISTYQYCDKRQWLAHLQTTHYNQTIQDINYTYDKIGHIAEIKDTSLAYLNFLTDFKSAEYTTSYNYDSLDRIKTVSGYTLVELEGNAFQPITEGGNVTNLYCNFFKSANQASAALSRKRYEENFEYDDGNNIIKHSREVDGHNNNEITLFQLEDNNNRIKQVQIVRSNASAETYSPQYDNEGNLSCSLFNSKQQNLTWDSNNRLEQYKDEVLTELYHYDEDFTRIIKITRNNETKVLVTEISLDEFLIHKFTSNHDSHQLDSTEYSIHLEDDNRCIATYLSVNGTIMYHLDNHLNSVALNINQAGHILNYEEYFTFGDTAFMLTNEEKSYQLKRYRYSGKERDKTTGLYYYGARYYAPWLCRWLSPDPAGLVDGLNVYAFVRNQPINYLDTNGLEAENQPKLDDELSISSVQDIVSEGFNFNLHDIVKSESFGKLFESSMTKVLGENGKFAAELITLAGQNLSSLTAEGVNFAKIKENLLKEITDQVNTKIASGTGAVTKILEYGLTNCTEKAAAKMALNVIKKSAVTLATGSGIINANALPLLTGAIGNTTGMGVFGSKSANEKIKEEVIALYDSVTNISQSKNLL